MIFVRTNKVYKINSFYTEKKANKMKENFIFIGYILFLLFLILIEMLFFLGKW